MQPTLFAGLILALLAPFATTEEPLRIQSLQRCGDLLAHERQQWCLRVSGIVAAMLSINPQLEPEQVRMLLRRSAMTIGADYDFEPTDADDLTAPILPSGRNYELGDEDVGRSARLDMHKALDLAVKSRDRVR